MSRKIYIIIAMVFTVVLSVSTFFIIRNHIDSAKQNEVYDNLAEIVQDEPPKENEGVTFSEDKDYLAEYLELYRQNEDMVGWIKVEDTNINYPVVQSVNEPNFYLKHKFDKTYSAYGCPYVQENCDVQKPSDNIIIYGHHMNDGSMFTGLMKYRNKSFWEGHKTITFDMQAAEGSFNTRYPHEPNGIKDPEYSIQCGVQELKAALTSAEVESPIDMEHIKLALQGYNFGNGYISWAKSKYGGYSYANAVEFSTQQAQRLGWDSYGDTQYPAHVLRYYPYGRAFTAGGNQAIVEVALTQLGNQGGQPYWSWYGFNSRVEWCACFVSWCADQCGYIESGLVPKFAGCVDGANWFKSNGKWQDRTYEPKAGDIIFFDWEGDGTTDHVGIVEKCENGTVYTVEGNSGDACKQRQYAVGSSNIYGYGIPAY